MLCMRRLKALCNLNCNADGFLKIQLSAFLDITFQRDSFHQLHDDIVQIALVADIVNAYDVRMGQARTGFGFLTEVHHTFRIAGVFRFQKFDCYHAV